MEQQSTSATPSKRQDYVQYDPQLVINYNQQYSHDHEQQQGLASPTQEHAEDSMLELKDVDALPSNYSFVSHQIPPPHNNNMSYPQQQPMMMMHNNNMSYPQQPQQVIYLPAENQQRVYETPSNNNYIHPGMIMNPNVPSGNHHNMPTSTPTSDENKYTTWTRVVMIFAIILGVYGCFSLVSNLLVIFSYTTNSTFTDSLYITSTVLYVVLSLLEVAAGAVGVWSTVTKNQKHRKYSTIAHLTLLSIVIIANIVLSVFGSLQVNNQVNEQNQYYRANTIIIVFAILVYVALLFACCGSCIACQAYRFRIMSKMQEQPETSQGEGFMVMRDEA